MKIIEAYQSSDGMIYPTLSQCQEHEASLQWREKIAEFTNSELCPYKKGIYASMLARTIVCWEQFKAEGL